MTDFFGGVAIPVSDDADLGPIGDPALGMVGAYLAATLNTYCGAAWLALRPRPNPGEQKPVRNVFTHNPQERSFNESQLPALFLWRDDSTFADIGDGWRRQDGKWRGLWIFPPDPQEKQTPRRPFGNAVAKVIDNALERGRDPSWVLAEDLDPGADGYDPTAGSFAADADSIRLSAATSTSPRTLSGAALDGVIGGDTMSPRREITVTTTASAGTYVGPVVITCVDWLDREITFSVALPADGGTTVAIGEDVKSVVSIDEPAQNNALGAISYGTSAVVGRGSVLLAKTRLHKLELQDSRPGSLRVDVLDADDRIDHSKTYDAVAFTLNVQERSETGLDDETRFFPLQGEADRGVDLTIDVDGFVTNRAAFNGDDAG